MLGERLGERVVLMLAEKDGVPIAGALNLAGRDALYGRNWGCSQEVPFLHFELLLLPGDRLRHRATACSGWKPGAQGEHKIQRGYLPKPTYSATGSPIPGCGGAVSEFLDRERPAVLSAMEELGELSPYRKGED